MSFTTPIQSFFPFGQGQTNVDANIQKSFPGLDFNAQEAGGEYQEIREIYGSLWFATNAQYNTTAALTPLATNAWGQVNPLLPSYALQLSSTGQMVRYSAAAVGGSGLTPMTFTLAQNNALVANGQTNTGYSFQRNKIINGQFAIDQRNQGASITPTAGQYSADRWKCTLSAASKYSIQQVLLSAGFPPSSLGEILVTSLSAYAVVASDNFAVSQSIEANNVPDLEWGSATAQPVTLSFWVNSSLSGTLPASIRNYAGTRSYPFNYTIPVANTWTYISVTIPGDTGGAWVSSGSGGSVIVGFTLGTGSTFQGTANTWQTGNFLAPTGSNNFVATNAATLQIAAVQLETGNQATPFEQRLYNTELALCQRYANVYNYSGATATFVGQATTAANASFAIPFPVTMRANPTLSTIGSFTSSPAAGGTGAAFASLTIFGSSPYSAGISATGASGLVAGNATLLESPAGTSQLLFSAEL